MLFPFSFAYCLMLKFTLIVTFVPNSALPILILFESITLSLYLYRYKILLPPPFKFYHLKKVEPVPMDQINVSLSFKHLPKQISAPLLVYVDMEWGICFITGPF